MPSFRRGVYINCPLDDEYLPLLRPLIFTVLALGMVPRLALERSDAAEPRIQKIVRLIQETRYAIHDLSRCRAEKRGQFFRLNMPLELGLDIGCKLFKPGRWRNKRCLILETERYRYQVAISDLSNSDIAAHKDEPEEVVRVVRDWLVQEAGVEPQSSSAIWGAFNEFMAGNFLRLREEGYTKREISRLPVIELRNQMVVWLRARAAHHKREGRGQSRVALT